jgi:hypothetical protein
MPARLLLPLALLLAAAPAVAQVPSRCAGDSAYAALDFWVGSWEVYVGDTLVGRNRISKILDGCAIVEQWRDARGGQGQSLFYIEPSLGQWRQVWVTDRARRPGGVKEKRLVRRFPGGAVRFQGEVGDTGGTVHLDRTTLSPLPGGEVRQLIEVSGDRGRHWRTTFDARYRRVPTTP